MLIRAETYVSLCMNASVYFCVVYVMNIVMNMALFQLSSQILLNDNLRGYCMGVLADLLDPA